MWIVRPLPPPQGSVMRYACVGSSDAAGTAADRPPPPWTGVDPSAEEQTDLLCG